MEKKRIKIDGKIYTKGVTCFSVDGKWTPAAKAALDTYTKEYKLKTSLNEVFDLESNGTAFSSSSVTLYISNKHITVCRSVVENNDEFIDNPVYHPNTDQYVSIYDTIQPIGTKYKPSSKIYNIANYDTKLSKYESIENILNFINYTFGFEIETSEGEINKQYGDNLGFASLYDGSITGVEYVSNPMQYNNLHYLHKFLDIAKMSTNINKYCSLHIHIGNVPKNNKNLLSIYLLFQRLTDDLNQLIVPYKKDIVFLYDKLKNAGRDHCKNLPKLPEKNIDEIYKLFRIPNYKDKDKELEKYITQNNKWNMEGRYYSVNFMNYICKSVNNTIEIRSLQSTYNFDYIITWLLINCSIIDYAVKNPDIVINSKVKVELDDCLENYIPNSNILNNLKINIANLRNLFYNSYHRNGDTLTNLRNLEYRIDELIKPYGLYNIKKDIKKSYYNKFINIKNNSATTKPVKKSIFSVTDPPDIGLSAIAREYLDNLVIQTNESNPSVTDVSYDSTSGTQSSAVGRSDTFSRGGVTGVQGTVGVDGLNIPSRSAGSSNRGTRELNGIIYTSCNFTPIGPITSCVSLNGILYFINSNNNPSYALLTNNFITDILQVTYSGRVHNISISNPDIPVNLPSTVYDDINYVVEYLYENCSNDSEDSIDISYSNLLVCDEHNRLYLRTTTLRNIAIQIFNNAV